MIPAERQAEILKYINNNGSADIKELMDLVKVSKSTIRRDLKKLSNKDLIERKHGGAIKKTMSTTFELQPRDKRYKNMKEKKQIARLALEYINNGDSIILDAGSTTYAISQKLKEKDRLTVISCDLRIALETDLSNSSKLIVPGGIRRNDYEVLIGARAENFLRDLSVDRAFIGADSIDLERGITNATLAEVSIKQQIINSAKETILVADHTKFGKSTLKKVAELAQVEHIITDKNIDTIIVEKLRKKNIWVEY